MAMDALALLPAHMLFVREFQSINGHLRALTRGLQAVAPFALARIVRLGMAAHAGGGIWNMHGFIRSRGSNPYMAFAAIDAFDQVLMVRKRLRLRRPNTEDLRARRQEQH